MVYPLFLLRRSQDQACPVILVIAVCDQLSKTTNYVKNLIFSYLKNKVNIIKFTMLLFTKERHM